MDVWGYLLEVRSFYLLSFVPLWVAEKKYPKPRSGEVIYI